MCCHDSLLMNRSHCRQLVVASVPHSPGISERAAIVLPYVNSRPLVNSYYASCLTNPAFDFFLFGITIYTSFVYMYIFSTVIVCEPMLLFKCNKRYYYRYCYNYFDFFSTEFFLLSHFVPLNF